MKTLTAPQAGFIAKLAGERDASTFDPILVARLDEARIGSLPFSEVTDVINTLKSIPRKSVAAAPTETGIFVTPEGTAIKVVKSQESGRLYTKTLVFNTFGGRTVMDWSYTPGVNVAGLPRIGDAQAAEVGLQCQQCINCLAPLGGDTMSAKVSAMIGFGETCARGNGWHYPKGVKAQRAFLAEHGVVA